MATDDPRRTAPPDPVERVDRAADHGRGRAMRPKRAKQAKRS